MFARIQRSMLARAAAFQSREDGQTMAEYGLLLALIALAVIVVAGLLGTAINDQFQAVVDAL